VADITLTPRLASTAACYTVRYALGRRSYAVGDACTLARHLWPALDAKARAVVLRDVREALADAERDGRTLGDTCDDRQWRELLAWMEAP
jgi:hypothetical protein